MAERELTFKELLKRADISGARLARKLGTTTATVSNWGCGKTAPSYDKLPLIAKTLDVSIETLVRCFANVEEK